MSAFGIFALILTTAYIIYFAVVIAKDIIAGKKSPSIDSSTESFDVSSFAGEDSVEVKEVDGGFAVGDNETYTETISASATTSENEGVSTENPVEKINGMTDKMDNTEEYVEFDVSIPDTHLRDFIINQQMANKNIDTSYMFDRQETAAVEPQKSSAGNAQGRDNL